MLVCVIVVLITGYADARHHFFVLRSIQRDAAAMPIDTDAKRRALFWNTCIPVRLIFASVAVIADAYDVRVLEYIMAAYLGGWALGMLRLYVVTLRSDKYRDRLSTARGAERTALKSRLYEIDHGNFGGRVWWQPHRLVHGSLLMCYAILTFASVPYASTLAVADVAYAVLAGIVHYRRVPRCW